MLHAKVGDFGISKPLAKPHAELSLDAHGHAHTGGIGTPRYMAPEVKMASSGHAYSETCDVYSYGVTVWELMRNERFPLHGAAPADKPFPISECSSSHAELISELIVACQNHDPKQRPTMNTCADELAALLRVLPRETLQAISLAAWQAAVPVESSVAYCTSSADDSTDAVDEHSHYTAKAQVQAAPVQQFEPQPAEREVSSGVPV